MKAIKLSLIYILSFMGFFFILSSCGMIWQKAFDFDSYKSIVSDVPWFFVYTILIGWWLALLPTREYYLKHYHYFKEL